MDSKTSSLERLGWSMLGDQWTHRAISHLSRATYSCVKNGPMNLLSRTLSRCFRDHVLLLRALFSLELLSRRFRGGQSHSRLSRVFRGGTCFGYFRDKLCGLRFGFRGDSVGYPPLLLCIVRVYGAAHFETPHLNRNQGAKQLLFTFTLSPPLSPPQTSWF